jgi:hypothetical protein
MIPNSRAKPNDTFSKKPATSATIVLNTSISRPHYDMGPKLSSKFIATGLTFYDVLIARATARSFLRNSTSDSALRTVLDLCADAFL